MLTNEEWYKHNFPELFGLPPKPYVQPSPPPTAQVVTGLPAQPTVYIGSQPVYENPSLLQQAQQLENSGQWSEAADLRLQQQAIHNQVVVAQAIPQMNIQAALASGNTAEAARQEQLLKEMEVSVRTGTAEQIIQKPEVAQAVSQMNQYQAEAEEAGKRRKYEAHKARKYGLFGPSWKSNGEKRKETMLEQGARHHPIVGGVVSSVAVPAIGMVVAGPVGAITAGASYGAVEHGAEGIPAGAIKGAIYAALAPTAGEALGVNPEGFGGAITGLNGPSLLNQLGVSSAPAIGGGIGLFGNLGEVGLVEQTLAPTVQIASNTTVPIVATSTTAAQSINLALTAAEAISSVAPVIGYYYANQLTEPRTTSALQSEQRKKRRKEFYRSIIGMGFGAFVASVSAPFLLAGQSSFVIALGEGAIFGGIASGISRRNAAQGAFEGAFFAGLGNIVDTGLSRSKYLSEAKRLREALGAAASSTVYIVVHNGKLEDVLIGAGSSALSNFLVPSVTGSVNEETLRVFVTGIVTSLMHRTELAQSLVAAGLGSVQARIQRIARQYGHDIAMSRQERRHPRLTNSESAQQTTLIPRRNNSHPSNVSSKIEGMLFEEAKLQMPGVNEQKLKQIIRSKLKEYPTPESRQAFVESLPGELKLKAYQYIVSQNPNGYQNVVVPLALGTAALFITGMLFTSGGVIELYQNSIRGNLGIRPRERFEEFDEDVYEPLDYSLDADSERNRGVYEGPDLSLEERLTRAIDGYQAGSSHRVDIGNTTPGFIPAPRHRDQRPGGYEPGRQHNADIGNSIPGFTPMHNNIIAMDCSIKSRIKDAQLPNEGRIRFIPPEDYNPSDNLRKGQNGGYIDKFKNEWTKGPSRTRGEPFEWDVQLSETGKKQLGWTSRDGNHINVSLKGHITHR